MTETIKIIEAGRVEVEKIDTYTYDLELFKTDLQANIVRIQTQIDYWLAEKTKAETRLATLNDLQK